MTEREKILDRIRKLLELSKDPDNENEAAAAAGAAQKLMEKHRIEEAMLDRTPADEPIENERLDGKWRGRGTTWKQRLAGALAKTNQCRIYFSGGATRLVGRPSDMATVRYMYEYLIRELTGLGKKWGKQFEDEYGEAPGRTPHNSFKIGAVNTISNRLYQAQKEARRHEQELAESADRVRGMSTALVRVNSAIAKIDERKAEVDTWVKKNLKLRTGRRKSFNIDGLAYGAGQNAGANVNLDGGGPALGAGARGALKP
jgi:hypothetical protein